MRLVIADTGPINYLVLIGHMAATLHADLLLMDDRKGVKAARGKGLRVTGTLGILELATRAGLVDFAQAVGLLQQTNFRSPEDLLAALLEKYRKNTI